MLDQDEAAVLRRAGCHAMKSPSLGSNQTNQTNGTPGSRTAALLSSWQTLPGGAAVKPKTSASPFGSLTANAPVHAKPTPVLMWTGLGCVWAGLVLFFLAVHFGFTSYRSGVQKVCVDSAPSVVLAQNLKSALADMDANALDVLLLPNGQSADYAKIYTQRRLEFADKLVSAAQNITYGDAERIPIMTLQNDLGIYEGLLAQARLLHLQGNDTQAVATYRHALHVLQDRLQPAADALDKANDDQLNLAYGGQQGRNTLALLSLMLGTLIALAPLAWLQLFLVQRTRRTLNAGLLGATVILVLFSVITLARFEQAGHELKVAKEDAFDSVRALWLARAVAYDANSDESRWLLDDQQKPVLQDAYFAKMHKLVTLGDGETYDSLDQAARAGNIPSADQGYLVDELRNITFPNEMDAATDTVTNFGVYLATDAKLRSLENAGQHAAAVQYDVSYQVNASDWAFTQFDNSLETTLKINDDAFHDATKAGFGAVAGYDWLLPIVVLVMATLAWFGMKPRLEEYKI